MYYLYSKNKGADQLRGYRGSDLCLCFRICKMLGFLMTLLIWFFLRSGYNIAIDLISYWLMSFSLSRLTLAARVRRDRTKYLISENPLLNLALLCVIHFNGRTFFFQNLGQIERQIFCPHLKNTIITDIGFCVFISLQ